MSASDGQTAPRRWDPWSTVFSAGVVVGSGAVLALAALLVPAGEGHGTHTQLGLGTCTILDLTGMPCPMCGATTTFALMAHLHPLAAVLNQPFAALLFVLTTFAFAIGISELVDPRNRWYRLAAWVEPVEGWLAAGFLCLMGAGWVYKTWWMGLL